MGGDQFLVGSGTRRTPDLEPLLDVLHRKSTTPAVKHSLRSLSEGRCRARPPYTQQDEHRNPCLECKFEVGTKYHKWRCGPRQEGLRTSKLGKAAGLDARGAGPAEVQEIAGVGRLADGPANFHDPPGTRPSF